MRTDARVLVTGASTGLGCFMAEHFARQGRRVFVTVRQPALPAALASFDNVFPLQVDVRSSDDVAAAFRTMTETYGVDGLDVLVNNAGIAAPGPLEELPVESMANQLDVNVLGVLRVTQQFLPLIRAARGKIINVGSMSVRMALPFAGAYGASKAALKAMSWAMRLELKPWSIGVFHLEAGNFDTAIWTKALAEGAAIQSTLYRRAIDTMLMVMKARTQDVNDPEQLWRAVDRICQGDERRFNIVVGRDALTRRVTTLLPDSVLEAIIARQLKP